MQRIIGLLGLFAFLLSLIIAATSEEQHPDRVIAKKKITGRLVSFEQGDYLHVTVKTDDEKEVSFFLGREGCFLAQNHNEILKIEYDEVEHYFPEGGGYYPANFIRAIIIEKAGKKWHATKDAKPTNLSEEQACFRVLEQLTVKPKGD